MKNKISVGDRYGRLTVIQMADFIKRDRVVWECECECGKIVNVVSSDLTIGDTKSCGCLKKELEDIHLREKYNEKRVDGVAMQLFKDKVPRKDSGTGYRGVTKYYTRKSKELRYRAWITVKGKRYYKSGFLTPEDAYNKGRLMLEEKHLPKKSDPST